MHLVTHLPLLQPLVSWATRWSLLMAISVPLNVKPTHNAQINIASQYAYVEDLKIRS